MQRHDLAENRPESSCVPGNERPGNHPEIARLSACLDLGVRLPAREPFRELNPHLVDTPEFESRNEARKPASVLIPILDRAEPTILLTVRSPRTPTHAGQVSLPGGKVQAGDRDRAHTALRETEEEVGIPQADVRVIGDLGDHFGGLGYCVTPYVGVVNAEAPLLACPREVAEIFEVPLGFVLDLSNHGFAENDHNGYRLKHFALQYRHYTIWGLTGGILRSFAEQARQQGL